MLNSNKPIGIFDSGVGGTSVWKEINNLLPNENTVYIADTANAPYGTKSQEQIIELSIKNTELLLNQNAKLIVIACNTATLNAINILRQKYDVPFIGLEPAIKPAALASSTKVIGVLATKASICSENFKKATAKHPNVKIIPQIGYNLVQLIESGKINSEQMTNLLEEYLNPMLDQNIDYLVLGCTHYPYLINQIQAIIPNTIKIIDSGSAVAKQTQKILTEKELLNTSTKKSRNTFYTNSDSTVLKSILGFSENVFEKKF